MYLYTGKPPLSLWESEMYTVYVENTGLLMCTLHNVYPDGGMCTITGARVHLVTPRLACCRLGLVERERPAWQFYLELVLCPTSVVASVRCGTHYK